LIDLFVVSVLLDAGSGNKWSYRSKESGKVFSRSEGLAVASLEMFKSGLFSSDPTEPCQVDGAGLKKVTAEVLAKGMQHSEQNPLAGIEGRAGLLIRLSEALNNQDFFGVDARPGNMLGKAIWFGCVLDQLLIFTQIIFSAIHPPLLLPYRLFRLPRCGPCLWMASLPSGPHHERRLMEYPLEMLGSARVSPNLLLQSSGRASFHSTS
jgi:hypothetical protein